MPNPARDSESYRIRRYSSKTPSTLQMLHRNHNHNAFSCCSPPAECNGSRYTAFMPPLPCHADIRYGKTPARCASADGARRARRAPLALGGRYAGFLFAAAISVCCFFLHAMLPFQNGHISPPPPIQITLRHDTFMLADERTPSAVIYASRTPGYGYFVASRRKARTTSSLASHAAVTTPASFRAISGLLTTIRRQEVAMPARRHRSSMITCEPDHRERIPRRRKKEIW